MYLFFWCKHRICVTEGEFISITSEGYACLPTLTQGRVTEPGILVGSGSSYFGWIRIRSFWMDLVLLVGPGSGNFGKSRIQVSWSDPDQVILVGPGFGSFGLTRIRLFWTDPVILVGSGYFGRIRLFWSDPIILVGSGYSQCTVTNCTLMIAVIYVVDVMYCNIRL